MNDERSRNPMGNAGATPSESWLFAQELLGRPVDIAPEPPAETAAERELHEWVQSITDRGRSQWSVAPALVRKPTQLPPPPADTVAERELREWVDSITNHSRSRPTVGPAFVGRPTPIPPTPATETAAQRELREWVESITVREGDWDPALHPRGGFPENAGWFSPSGGGDGGGGGSGGTKASGGAGPLRSWPEPVERGESHQKKSTKAPDRAPHTDQLAFEPPRPQQGQPRVIQPGQAGQPAQQPGAPAAGPKPFPNDFGTFRRQPGESADLWTTLPATLPPTPTRAEQRKATEATQDTQALSARLQTHVGEQIPERIKDPLRDGKVKVVVTPSPADAGLASDPDKNTGGLYDSQRGKIYLPLKMADGSQNPNPERNLRHEFGHAFDHKTNGSTSPEFRQAYWDDLHAAGKDLRDKELDHYVPGPVGEPITADERVRRTNPKERSDAEREAFAEAFAEATQKKDQEGNPTELGPRATAFRRTFPRTIAHVKDKADNYGR